MEGEHAPEEGALLGPRSGLLLLTQDRQVEVVGRAALLLTACNMLRSHVQVQSWRNTSSPISAADPDPGSGGFLTPGSGMGKNQDPDPG